MNICQRFFESSTVMRLFAMLCRRGSPQNPNKVPLAKPRLPLALRDRVGGSRNSKDSTASALKEMQILINKLAQNDWNQEFCKKEIADMRAANTASYMNYLKEKRDNRMGVIKPGLQLDSIPLTKYLKANYPVAKPNPFEDKIQELPIHKRKR